MSVSLGTNQPPWGLNHPLGKSDMMVGALDGAKEIYELFGSKQRYSQTGMMLLYILILRKM